MKQFKSLLHAIYARQSIRRSMVFLWLIAGIVICYVGAFLLRYDGSIPIADRNQIWKTVPYAVGFFVVLSLIFGVYKGIWSLFSFGDCVRHALVFFGGSGLFAILIYFLLGNSFEGYPRSVFIIYPMLLLGWEFLGRAGTRIIRLYLKSGESFRDGTGGENLVLISDAHHADQLLRAMRSHESGVRIRGIFSLDDRKGRVSIRGVRFHYSLRDLIPFMKDIGAASLLFLPPYTSPRDIRLVIDCLQEASITASWRILPSIADLASGSLLVESIRKVEIEDLLERPHYELDVSAMRNKIWGKRLLITGAGGSIGSEICRQVLRFAPKSVTLFEISEYNLFQIEREMKTLPEARGVEIIGLAGDVKNQDQVKSAIRITDGIDIIFHSAAYKHVDLMERNAAICFQNNVVGTHVVAMIAEQEKVGDFVLISTDKAVKPTSLMGASKRLAERIVIERPPSETRYVAVRFGNVLGSSGSVVPIFREQIAAGGPVTVTSPNVTRYFMTIPEAVELVLAAGSVNDDRRIFVLEMGKAVLIDSMARRMIELSGFVPEVDIPISYTGLKPGEKEYEELLTEEEGVVRTELDRIWVVEQSLSEDAATLELGRLLELIDSGDHEEIRQYVHSLIPGSKLLSSE